MNTNIVTAEWFAMLVVSSVIYVLCSLKKIAAISKKKKERKKKRYQKNKIYEVTVYLQNIVPLG